MGDKEVQVNPLEEINDLVQIPKVSEKPSDSTSVETASVKIQGEKNMTESLAVEIMELVESMTASPSQLPQSADITPEVHIHSLNMGDEHLSTVPEIESDEFIKSSVEDLVPIPGESQGTFDHMCDLPSPLECPKDQFETFSDCSEDCASYGDIEYVEASVPHSDVDHLLEEFTDKLTHINPLPTGSDDDLIDFEADLGEIEGLLYHDPSLTSYPNSTIENVNHFVPEAFKTTLTNPLFEFESEFTLIYDNPVFGIQNEDSDESTSEHEFTDLYLVINSLHEEFSGELTHIISPPEYDNFHFDPDTPGICPDHVSLNDEIHNIEIMDSPVGEDELVMIFIMVFFLFFTYPVTSSLLHSFGNEDTIFDPRISIYHYLEPGSIHLIGVELSRASNVCPNILNESPMEIISST